MAKVKKSGSIRGFILGVIFAIIVVFAGIAAGIYYLYKVADLEELLSLVGVENSTYDEDSDTTTYTFIDTSQITSISELISALSGLASDFSTETTTLNDLVEKGFTAVGTAVDAIYDAISNALSGYMTAEEFAEIFDKDELMDTPISGISDFIYSSLLGANVEIIFSIAGIDITDNILYLNLAYGAEAAVGTYNGKTVPLSLDTFSINEAATYSTSSAYTRKDGKGLYSEYEEYLVEEADGTYSLYCYVTEDADGEEIAYVAKQGTDGAFSVTAIEYEQYSSEYTAISGAYWYDGDTLNVISKRTLSDFVGEDADIAAVFDNIYLSDLISSFIKSGDDNVILNLLKGYTLGDILSGNISLDSIFDGIVENVYIPDFINIPVENAILVYFGYAINGVTAEAGEDYSYTGTINFYTENGDGWTTTTVKAYISVDEEGYISSVYYYDESNNKVEYSGVSVSKITTLINNFMNTLTVNDILSMTGVDTSSKILQKLGSYTLGNLSNAFNELMVSDLISVSTDDNGIILYMVYGITDLSYDEATQQWSATYHCTDSDCADGGTHEVIVEVEKVTETENGVTSISYTITRVYYTQDGEEVEVGTYLNNVTSRISGLFYDVTIGDMISDIDPSDTVLYALRNSTISSLLSDIKSLTIQQIFAESIYGTEKEDGTTTLTLYVVVSEGSSYDEETQIAFNSSYLYYYYDSEGNLVLAGNNGHLDSYPTDISYTLYTYGGISSVWKLLLYTTDTTDSNSSYETAVTINNVADMQSNLMCNLQSFTLNDLYEIGILSGDDVEKTLEKTINVNGTTTKIGSLTLNEFISNIGNLLSSDLS